MNIYIIFCLCLLFFLSAGCTYTSISTRQHQVIFQYSDQIRSEKDLPFCGETSVCSVLYKRYWLPTISQRLCRCPNNNECPWKWTNKIDNQTMVLNNRSQLKFCFPVDRDKPCTPQKTALTIESTTSQDTKLFYEIKTRCYCASDYRWKHVKTTQYVSNINDTSTTLEEYKCTALKRCRTNEFCGNVRSDYSSIYYKCSCPVGHYCLHKNRSTKNVQELLYKGPVFKAFCEPENQNDYDY